MGLLETGTRWLVDVVGVQGVQVGVLFFLLSAAFAASRLASVGGRARRVGVVASTTGSLLFAIKVVAIALLIMVGLGIATIHTAQVDAYLAELGRWAASARLEARLAELLG